MEFKQGNCPCSQGELQDEYLEMADVSDEAATAALKALLFGIEDPMQYFKRATYMDFYKKYLYDNAYHLSVLEQVFLSQGGSVESMTRVAEPMAAAVDERLASLRGKKRNMLQLDYNMAMVVYVFPALLEHCERSGRVWTEVIAAVWKKHFPKSDIKAATAAEINAGFKYRFCYITTAVCRSQDKPDDCYELQLLRRFRDEYLLQNAGGEALVHEYYDVAPTIVKHIDKTEHAGSIYEMIWHTYLSPCIRMIEADQKEACVELYRKMVYKLKDQYFSSI